MAGHAAIQKSSGTRSDKLQAGAGPALLGQIVETARQSPAGRKAYAGRPLVPLRASEGEVPVQRLNAWLKEVDPS